MNITKQKTHLLTSKKLVGSVISIENDTATVTLKITKKMVVDSFNLTHGGFVFGLADYAAMIAINKPTVVLGKAEVKFMKPVIINEKLTAKATISERISEKKIVVNVHVSNQKEELVFEGVFVCFVLEKHILEK